MRSFSGNFQNVQLVCVIVQYIHALAEDTKLPSESQDLITMQFMIHELPREATRAILKECYRLLRKGGVLALCDNNPSSPVIRNLPQPSSRS
eukprot:g37644.t1